MKPQSQYSTESSGSKVAAAYATGIPAFLKKARDRALWKKKEVKQMKTTMISAIERHEQDLSRIENKKRTTMQSISEHNNEINKIMEIEDERRKINVKNMHDYVSTQIKERVC